MRIISIIPTFNRPQELKNLLSNLAQMEKPENVEFNHLCVVNGLKDGTLEMLNANFPNVHVLKGDKDWWYTKSMNEGFRRAEALNPDLILTLNDDILLPKDYLCNLLENYRNLDQPCILGSASFTQAKPHRITNSGVKNWNKYLDKTTTYYPFLSEVDPSTISGIHPTPVLPGRGTLIPWVTLKKLQFFDEVFAQYHSDFDFTLRAIKANIPVYVCWDAKVFSYLEKTNSGSSFLKSSLGNLFMNFVNPYSRVYIPDKARYFWRHGFKLLWPWYMLKVFLISFKNHFFKKKIGQL